MQYLLTEEEFDKLQTTKGQEELGRGIIKVLEAIHKSPKESMVSKFGLYESLTLEMSISHDPSRTLIAWMETFLIIEPKGVLKVLKDC